MENRREQTIGQRSEIPVVECAIVIENDTGLHARPAELFVQTAGKFPADITVELNGRRANAKSILAVIALGAARGSRLTIRAAGDRAEKAVAALADLVQTSFGQ